MSVVAGGSLAGLSNHGIGIYGEVRRKVSEMKNPARCCNTGRERGWEDPLLDDCTILRKANQA